jgi:hypothetical protein
VADVDAALHRHFQITLHDVAQIWIAHEFSLRSDAERRQTRQALAEFV